MRSRKNHAKLVRKINNCLEKEEFILKHKTSESAFTRKRCFTFKSISLFIISSIQSGVQRELDRFFGKYNDTSISGQFVSKSAFSQARKKICPEAFNELNRMTIDHFYSTCNYHKWKNHRLIAIDGSEVLLPPNQETIAEFGDYKTSRTKRNVVIARFSKSYDVLNRIAVDARLTKRTNGEHYLAEQHLTYAQKNDLILLDRGYPSFTLFRIMLDRGCNFCFRLSVNNWKIAQELVTSDKKESIVNIEVPKHLKKKFYKKHLDTSAIKLRLIKIKLKSGEYEVLITSLLDGKGYDHSCFRYLYNLRWGVEESFKIDKHHLRLEDFSGYSVQSIMQEFNAMILLFNLASVFSYYPSKEIKKKVLKYKINITVAISKFRDNIVTIFKKMNEIGIIKKVMNAIFRNLTPIRDERCFERNVYRRRRYHYQYKNM